MIPATLKALPPRETAVEACARAIRESILSGGIPAGDRLPPERELAATLGVNRLTLRNALGQLVAAGLVSVRQGSGYVVRDFAEAGGPDLVEPLIRVAKDPATRREAMADLLLLRRALARAAIERLLHGLNKAGVARISEAIEAFAAIADRKGASIEELARADHHAIRVILRETGSVVLQLAGNPIFRLSESLPDLTAEIFSDPSLVAAGYRLMLTALQARDREAADRVLEMMAVIDAGVIGRMERAESSKRPRRAARKNPGVKK